MCKLLEKAKEICSRSRATSPGAVESSLAPVASFPDGVKVLYSCTDASVDICFVHGLTGNREDTWTAQGELRSWPEVLLPLTLQKARVLTYGYDAYVLRKSVASSNRLIDHSTNLLNDLAAERASSDSSSRPIIFVAHSLGGLVCKHALLLSRNKAETHLKSISIYTKGIMFLGTPHGGSWMADWARIPASALGLVKSTNKSLLKILETDDQLLESIQIDFLSMLRSLSSNGVVLQVTCFFEELPLPGIGKIVSKESATFTGYTPISIHANHSGMVKFASAEETGFKRVVAELVRWEAELRNSSKSLVHFNSRETREEHENPSSNKEGQRCSEKSYTRCIARCLNLPPGKRSDVAIPKVIEALKLEDDTKRLFENHSTGKWYYRNEELEEEIKKSYDDAAERCLKSLSFPGMKVREANIDRPTEDTCVWIYQDPVYCLWEAQQHALLWIKGHPGSGKSVLIKSLYSTWKRMPISSLHLCFFFNARGAAIEKTPLGLYITLLHDLLGRMPVVLCEFLPRFLEKEMISTDNKVSWNLVEVADAFHEMIACKQPRPINILIDALDECKEDEVRSVIRKFESIIADARRAGAELKVCWSSRYYPHVSLVSEDGLELRLDEQNNNDISQYVRKEFRTGSDAVLLSMQHDLIRKANGVFLWAVLVIRQLHAAIDKGKTELELKHLLNSIPTKLDDLFDDIFQEAKASPSQGEELLLISRWVFCSEKPLTAANLFTALQLQKSPQPCSIVACSPTREDIDRLLKRVVDLSRGLFEGALVYRAHRENSDMSSERDQGVFNARVQVIHESVREFFLGSKGRKLLQVSSTDDFFLDAHEYMAQTCFQALLSIEFAGSATGFRKLDSICEISTLLLVYSKPLDHDFLIYAQRYGFGHFDKARDRITKSTSTETTFCSLEMRRKALVNTLRVSFAQLVRIGGERSVLETQLAILGKDPAAFGVERAEYWALRSFFYDLQVFVASFPTLSICLSENPDGKRNNSDCTEFHALYFVDASSKLSQLELWPSRKLDDTNLEKLFLMLTNEGVDLRFVFAATFWVAGTDATARLRYRMAEPYGSPGEVQIEKWGVEEDIQNLVDLIDGHRFLSGCKQAKVHDFHQPEMLCAVLEGSKEDGGNLSQKLPATDHVYDESLVGYMYFRIVDGHLRLLQVDHN